MTANIEPSNVGTGGSVDGAWIFGRGARVRRWTACGRRRRMDARTCGYWCIDWDERPTRRSVPRSKRRASLENGCSGRPDSSPTFRGRKSLGRDRVELFARADSRGARGTERERCDGRAVTARVISDGFSCGHVQRGVGGRGGEARERARRAGCSRASRPEGGSGLPPRGMARRALEALGRRSVVVVATHRSTLARERRER